MPEDEADHNAAPFAAESVLEGRVTDPGGLPVEGALVWLYPKFRWHVFFKARTDADGRYRVTGIWSGDDGPNPEWGKYTVGIKDERFAAPTREIAFGSGQKIEGFDFRLIPGTQIDGHLYDPETRQPVAGGSVQMDSASGRQYMTTGSAGEFTCRVAPGTIRAFFVSPPEGTYVTQEDETRPRSYVRTEAGGERCEVHLSLPGHLEKVGTVHGRVENAEGAPVPDCEVAPVISGGRLLRYKSAGNQLKPIPSAGDGKFSVSNIPIGLPFKLIAKTADGKLMGIAEGLLNSDSMELAAPVVVGETRPLEVWILDSAGKPRPDLLVIVTGLVDGEPLVWQKQTYKTDSDGVLAIPNVMPGGQYLIAEAGAEYARAELEVDAQPRSLILSGEFAIRLLDLSGQAVSIHAICEYWIHIVKGRQMMRWTNTPLKITRREGDRVFVSRQSLGRCRPGWRIDFTFETEARRIMNAGGVIPGCGEPLIVVREIAPVIETGEIICGPVDESLEGERPGVAVTMQLIDCQTGEPVPGLEVVIYEHVQPNTIRNRRDSNRISDSQGMLHWESLPLGMTVFGLWPFESSSSRREPCTYVRWWLADGAEEERRFDYKVRPPRQRTGVGMLNIEVMEALPPVKICVEKGARISGTVIGPDGKPAAGVRVGVVVRREIITSLTGDSWFTAKTDAGGEFMEYIPAGNGIAYSLSAFVWAQELAAAANAVSETFFSRPGDELTFNLRMTEGGWIAGRVIGPDPARFNELKVTATAQDRLDSSYGDRIVPVAADGRFRVGPLRSGRYMIRAGIGEGAPLGKIADGELKDAGQVEDGEEIEIGDLFVPPDFRRGR